VHNTVMVDDTPAKLRAQPYSLVAAPTFDYPLAPLQVWCQGCSGKRLRRLKRDAPSTSKAGSGL
jgi:hypothetical protein